MSLDGGKKGCNSHLRRKGRIFSDREEKRREEEASFREQATAKKKRTGPAAVTNDLMFISRRGKQSRTCVPGQEKRAGVLYGREEVRTFFVLVVRKKEK